jgi:nicotinamidase-related amidase
MQMLTLPPKSSALVLIDLQKGITSFPIAPRASTDVVRNATSLANRFREIGAPVFLVRVAFPTGETALKLITDAQPPLPASEPEGWLELAVEPHQQDILILKRHWGAFYGTELDLQLRRRGIETIVLGGISTNSVWNLPPATLTSSGITRSLRKTPWELLLELITNSRSKIFFRG